VLDLLRDSGPLPSRDVLDRSAVAVHRLDEQPQRHPDAGVPPRPRRDSVSGRDGRQRLWDLAERVYPADTPIVPAAEAVRMRDERRLHALGVAR
jgi:hypothetical protein